MREWHILLDLYVDHPSTLPLVTLQLELEVYVIQLATVHVITIHHLNRNMLCRKEDSSGVELQSLWIPGYGMFTASQNDIDNTSHIEFDEAGPATRLHVDSETVNAQVRHLSRVNQSKQGKVVGKTLFYSSYVDEYGLVQWGNIYPR